jgi:outer membrane lipoprotein carrier protein
MPKHPDSPCAALGLARGCCAPAALRGAPRAASGRREVSGRAVELVGGFHANHRRRHGKVLRSAAGKLYLQRPGKFRWDYTEPSEQLVLADGKQIWFYDKDLAQANVRDMDATLASTPAMLLVGRRLGEQPVRHQGAAGERGLEWFQLMPKHADTDFQLVRIGFDKGELRRCSSRTSSIRSRS